MARAHHGVPSVVALHRLVFFVVFVVFEVFVALVIASAIVRDARGYPFLARTSKRLTGTWQLYPLGFLRR